MIKRFTYFLNNFKTYFKNHRKRTSAGILILIVLAIIFWPRPPKPLETQTGKKTDIVESISASGTVNATSSVDLNFLSAGKLVYLGIKKGDTVEAGQVIATLDQRSVQKNLEDDLRDYAKQRNTFDQTKEDNQNRTPEEALNDEMKRILQNNQYDLEKAVISVELLDLAKQQSVLITPIAGIVTSADVSTPGVNVGLTTTFTVADPEDLVFRIDIDEADIGKVQAGQSVKVVFDAYPDESFNLTVGAIDFAAHETSVGGNAYTVETQLSSNQDLKFRIGMTGEAEIVIAKKEETPVVSLASITDDNSVYVKTGNSFEKRKVKPGIQSDTEIEILGGLKEGEEVALNPDDAAELVSSKKKRFFFF